MKLHSFGEADSTGVVTCSVCGHRVRLATHVNLEKIIPGCTGSADEASQAQAAPVEAGPGTEYARLVATLGLRPKAGCQCKAIERDMNAVGVEGCRERRAEFIERLQANYAAHYSYLDILTAALRAKKGEALAIVRRLKTLKPNAAIERLFDLAVAAAEV